jgi:non-specific serine/threonine protein kinase
LLDFGSARRIIGDGTQALTTILKPGYAPVEQYVDDGTMKQGPWTDVYALGGVLYHLATGTAPLQAVSRLLSDPLQTVNQATHDAFSPRFSNAVAQAMAVRVEDRLKTVKELRDALGWNVVQSARVVTLPSHSLSKPVSDTAPVDEVARSEVQAQTLVVSDDAKPVFVPVEGPSEKPTYPLVAPPSPLRALLVAIAIGVVAVVAWFGYNTSRPSATAMEMVPTAPVAVPVVAAVKESPATPVPVASVAVAPASAGPISDKVAASASSVPSLPKMGIVNLNIVPWGAVVIDGVTRGISNPNQLRRMELPVGTHTFEIAKPDAQPLKQIIEVGEAPVSISHTFK